MQQGVCTIVAAPLVALLGLSGVAARRAYAARDVVNAPQLKASIAHRSQARGDAAEVRAWLLNHFYRHVVGNLKASPPALQCVESLDQARRLFAPAPLPGWVHERLGKSGAAPALWWIDPSAEAIAQLEHRLVEFLGSRAGTPLEDKLMRINCPQALALWAAEHAAMEARSAAGWRESSPLACALRWQGQQGAFVELLPDRPELRAEMAYESQAMRHCLGQFADRRALTGGYGEHYAQACEQGKLRLFSYRTGAQQPHITMSAVVTADGRLAIDQIKGKQNRPPIARYRDDVRAFLNTLSTNEDTPADAAVMGIVRLSDRWVAVSEATDAVEQLRLAHRHPSLVRQLPSPSAAVQWLVAARDPALLEAVPQAPSVARALQGAAWSG